jgi:hypothetical protein
MAKIAIKVVSGDNSNKNGISLTGIFSTQDVTHYAKISYLLLVRQMILCFSPIASI